MTKAMGERLWLARNDKDAFLPTMFSAVRYGNVMGSNGSVIPIWREQAARGEPITVRSPETTRFFMRVEDALDLVMKVVSNMQGGEIFVPAGTPAFELYDLARCFQDERYWDIQPLGSHEKQHEVLIAPGEYHEPALEGAWKVLPDVPDGWWGIDDKFCSKTAKRISGEEVIRQIGA
jgi:UDP-N-acetylglucosamine 4,6-dehydratase